MNQKRHKRHSKDEYNNNFNDEYINESCYYCGEEFIHVEDIFIDAERDIYICEECSIIYNINVIKCKEIDY